MGSMGPEQVAIPPPPQQERVCEIISRGLSFCSFELGSVHLILFVFVHVMILSDLVEVYVPTFALSPGNLSFFFSSWILR